MIAEYAFALPVGIGLLVLAKLFSGPKKSKIPLLTRADSPETPLPVHLLRVSTLFYTIGRRAIERAPLSIYIPSIPTRTADAMFRFFFDSSRCKQHRSALRSLRVELTACRVRNRERIGRIIARQMPNLEELVLVSGDTFTLADWLRTLFIEGFLKPRVALDGGGGGAKQLFLDVSYEALSPVTAGDIVNDLGWYGWTAYIGLCEWSLWEGRTMFVVLEPQRIKFNFRF